MSRRSSAWMFEDYPPKTLYRSGQILATSQARFFATVIQALGLRKLVRYIAIPARKETR